MGLMERNNYGANRTVLSRLLNVGNDGEEATSAGTVFHTRAVVVTVCTPSRGQQLILPQPLPDTFRQQRIRIFVLHSVSTIPDLRTLAAYQSFQYSVVPTAKSVFVL